MKNIFEINDCPLFSGLKEYEQHLLFDCFYIVEKTFKKGSYIINYGDEIKNVLIIKEGSVCVVEDDYWGNRSIISYLDKNNIFGIAYAYSNNQAYPISLIAMSDCKILFIDIKKIFNPCSKKCYHHTQLMKNAVMILSNKNIALINKIEHMSKRTIKDKVLSYLSNCSKIYKSNHFHIPFNRQELADYLAVDRSALCATLSKLKKAKIIDYHKNNFTIFYQIL